MATGIQNAITIEIDATSPAFVEYTLPRDGRVVDIVLQNTSAAAAITTVTLGGVFLATVPNNLPTDGLTRAVAISDAAADGLAGEILRFSWGISPVAYFKAYVTFLAPVA